MIKITSHFPNALHQKFFYTISCVQFVVGTKSDLEQDNQFNKEPRIWRHGAHSFLGFLASNNKTADYRENIRCVVFYDGL